MLQSLLVETFVVSLSRCPAKPTWGRRWRPTSPSPTLCLFHWRVVCSLWRARVCCLLRRSTWSRCPHRLSFSSGVYFISSLVAFVFQRRRFSRSEGVGQAHLLTSEGRGEKAPAGLWLWQAERCEGSRDCDRPQEDGHHLILLSEFQRQSDGYLSFECLNVKDNSLSCVQIFNQHFWHDNFLDFSPDCPVLFNLFCSLYIPSFI